MPLSRHFFIQNIIEFGIKRPDSFVFYQTTEFQTVYSTINKQKPVRSNFIKIAF